MATPVLTTVAKPANTTVKTAKSVTPKNGIIKLNDTAVEVDPIKCFRDTVGIGSDENGVEYVMFSVNKGPGSSSQMFETRYNSDLLTAMRQVAHEGIPDKNAVISPAEMFLSTIKLDDDGMYVFRLAPGAKSVKLSPADFSRFVNEFDSLDSKIAAAKSKAAKTGR